MGFGCWPVWEERQDGVANVPPAALPISSLLRTDLERWAAWYEQQYDSANPVDSGFDDRAEAIRFNQAGEELRRRLADELEGVASVTFRPYPVHREPAPIRQARTGIDQDDAGAEPF
ncbi:hypothetical protein L1857_22410 [Amycolatopsis thermalba]|uniref:Uncharacterized protein n=1 Tax=Amycolatopsis thermalba TaxID=944492 RepID=A0ABY4NZ83_9PSEU|nr:MULTISPECIES: hypothetical protein [Amycolatopsis]UQS25364.1 hypothetical protein L1857_22410 [Amycolatopsis thermalba]